MDISLGTLIRRHSIVQIQLAGRLLLEQRPDSVKVALRFKGNRLVFGNQSFRPVHLSLILFRVNDKEYLILVYARTLFEHHFLQITFHPRPDFHKLLSANLSREFSINLHIACADGIHTHDRKNLFHMFRPQKNNEHYCHTNDCSNHTNDCLFIQFTHKKLVSIEKPEIKSCKVNQWERRIK